MTAPVRPQPMIFIPAKPHRPGEWDASKIKIVPVRVGGR